MRLREVQTILLKHLPPLASVEMTPEQIAPGQVGMRVRGLAELRRAVVALAKVTALDAEIGRVGDHALVGGSVGDSLYVDAGTAEGLGVLLRRAHDIGTRLLVALRAALPQEEPLSVAFRLPNVTGLSDLTCAAKEIEDVFAQTLAVGGHGSARVIGFDTGSMHIEIGLDTAEALALISAMVTMATLYFRNRAKILEQREAARKHSAAADWPVVERTFQTMISVAREESVTGAAPAQASPEERARLGAAIEKMADLMEHGADVVPALNAPPEIRKKYETARGLLSTRSQAAPQLGAGSQGQDTANE